MKEIEIKVININKEEIEKRLVEAGAKLVFDGELHSVYFDKDNLLKEKQAKLRLREDGKKAMLNLKTEKEHTTISTCNEYEVKVEDAQKTKEILIALGFQPWITLRKKRKSFFLNNVKFEFDNYLEQYDFLPEFLEIEAPDEQTIYAYVDKMGIPREHCKAWGLKDLIAHYSK